MDTPSIAPTSNEQQKPVRLLFREALSTGDTSGLVDFVERGGKLSGPMLAELLRRARPVKEFGGQRGLRLDGTETEKHRERAKLCAAYVIRTCAGYYRDGSGQRITPRSILKEIEKRALKSVNAHFKITLPELSIIGPDEELGTQKRHGLHERKVHDEICEMVHDTRNNTMHADLMKILDWLDETYFTPRG